MPNKELGIADPVYDALRIRSGQSIAPDLGGGSFGAGGLENKIQVWHADGSAIDLFDPTTAGLTLALAAWAAGDVIWIPACTIAGNFTITQTVRGLDQFRSVLSGTITLQEAALVSDLGFTGIVDAGGACIIYRCSIATATAPALTLTGTVDHGPSVYFSRVTLTSSGASDYALACTGYCYVEYTEFMSFTNCASIDNAGAYFSHCRFQTSAGVSGTKCVNLVNGVLSNCVLKMFAGNGLVFAGGTATVANTHMRAVTDPTTQKALLVTATGLSLCDCSFNSESGLSLCTMLDGDRAPWNHSHTTSVPAGQPPVVVRYDNVGADYLVVTDNASYNAFPGFVRAANGTFILVYRKGINHDGDNGTIVQKTSTDGGLTWSAETTIVNEVGTYDARDSRLTLLANGDLIMSYAGYIAPGLGDQAWIKKSTDNGATWGAAINVTSSFTSGSTCSSPVVELANGDLLLALHGSDIGDTYASARVSKSTNAGTTWANLALIADGDALSKHTLEPNIVLMNDGSLLCMMRLQGADTTIFPVGISTSTNSGATWSAVAAAWNFAGNPNPLHLASDSVICITRKATTFEMIARSTTDGGATWSDEIILDTSTYDAQQYAQGEEIYPGLIAVAYAVGNFTTNSDIRFMWIAEGGNPDAGDALVGSSLTVYGGDITIIGGGQIVSTTPTGTAPLVVASTTKVDNLNADMVDGLHASQLGHTIQNEGTPLTQRSNLNFVGALVNATDDAGNNATIVTVNGALNDLTDVDTAGEATGDVIYDNAGTWQVYPLGLGSRITVSGTKIRFGNVGGGNYLEIDSVTGTLRLVGDATTYDDFRVEASVVKPGATAPNWKAFGPSGNLQALMFEASHHDEAYFEMQMPHNWKLGTNIYPHVHWTPVNTTAGNVVWELEYSWANVGSAFGAPGNMATDATAAGGTAWVHKLTDFKEGGNNYINGAGKTLSSMLVCRLHRNSNSGSDTLNQDVALLEVDFHYQIDSLGSDEPLVKDASASLLLETGDILLLETGDRLLTE